MRTADAIAAWESALKVAPDDKEREGVYIHLARIKLNAERFEEVHRLLNSVTNEMYASLKNRLLRNLERQEKAATGTNAPAQEANK
jgi:predicted negative regulator of RcsB-dependent stress response